MQQRERATGDRQATSEDHQALHLVEALAAGPSYPEGDPPVRRCVPIAVTTSAIALATCEVNSVRKSRYSTTYAPVLSTPITQNRANRPVICGDSGFSKVVVMCGASAATLCAACVPPAN